MHRKVMLVFGDDDCTCSLIAASLLSIVEHKPVGHCVAWLRRCSVAVVHLYGFSNSNSRPIWSGTRESLSTRPNTIRALVEIFMKSFFASEALIKHTLTPRWMQHFETQRENWERKWRFKNW